MVKDTRSLPPEVPQLYSLGFQHHREQQQQQPARDPELAHLLLSVLLAAREPLSPFELNVLGLWDVRTQVSACGALCLQRCVRHLLLVRVMGES